MLLHIVIFVQKSINFTEKNLFTFSKLLPLYPQRVEFYKRFFLILPICQQMLSLQQFLTLPLKQ